MIRRTFDPAEVNVLLNEPDVRENLGGFGPLDARDLLSDRRNICLVGDMGGAMFAWRGPGIFEGHSFFRCRGKSAILLGAWLLALLFEEHNARMVWGLTPEHLKHVRWFNRQVGFRSHGLMETPDGMCELFVMR